MVVVKRNTLALTLVVLLAVTLLVAVAISVSIVNRHDNSNGTGPLGPLIPFVPAHTVLASIMNRPAVKWAVGVCFGVALLGMIAFFVYYIIIAPQYTMADSELMAETVENQEETSEPEDNTVRNVLIGLGSFVGFVVLLIAAYIIYAKFYRAAVPIENDNVHVANPIDPNAVQVEPPNTPETIHAKYAKMQRGEVIKAITDNLHAMSTNKEYKLLPENEPVIEEWIGRLFDSIQDDSLTRLLISVNQYHLYMRLHNIQLADLENTLKVKLILLNRPKEFEQLQRFLQTDFKIASVSALLSMIKTDADIVKFKSFNPQLVEQLADRLRLILMAMNRYSLCVLLAASKNLFTPIMKNADVADLVKFAVATTDAKPSQ